MAHHEHAAAWAGVAATQEKGETDSAEATLEGQPLRTSKTKRRHALQMGKACKPEQDPNKGSHTQTPSGKTHWRQKENPVGLEGELSGRALALHRALDATPPPPATGAGNCKEGPRK